MDSDYKKWKRNNVTLRGMKELGKENDVYGSYGKGLYTVQLGNKAMAKQYGKVYFVVNAIPKNPKTVQYTNDAEIFIQRIVDMYCKKNDVEYSLSYFSANTTIEQEMLKFGYDGLVIKGREMVNYTPTDIKYFETETELQNYYENVVAKKEFKQGGAIENHEQKKLYAQWKSLVNMTENELQTYYESQDGKTSGLSRAKAAELNIKRGRDSAKWILKMKDTPVADWTTQMWEWADRQVRFIKRMRGVKGKLYDENKNKTRKHKALLIWGHNPLKYNDGGAIDGENLVKLEIYEVIENGETFTEIITITTDEDEARNEFEFADYKTDTRENKYGIQLQKRTNVYRWIADSEEYEIADYPIEDYYEDESLYELVTEGDIEEIDMKEVVSPKLIEEQELEKYKEELKSDVIAYLKKICSEYKHAGFLRSTFYGLYPYKDGFIQLRCADHFFNISNVHLGERVLWDDFEYSPERNVYKTIYGFISIHIIDDETEDRRGFRAEYNWWKDTSKELKHLVNYIELNASEPDLLVNWEKDIESEISDMQDSIDEALEKGLYNDEIEFADGGKVSENKGADEEVVSFELYLEKKYGAEVTLSVRKNYVERAKADLLLSKIVVPKANRGKGLGTQIMDEIIDFCNQNEYRLILTPDTSFGGTSTLMLNKFYKRFGLIDNRGRAKDYSIRESMYKYPDTYAKGGLIKRADGTYSKRGLWDNIRANIGSGKKPTPQMLKQAKLIKLKYNEGGAIEEGISIEKEHKQLYEKIKKALAKKGIKMPVTEQDFYTEIAQAHIDENPQYYKLLKKYVEKARGGDVSTLLAPNGKPSNLTPEQYKMVRTPEFKAWFGDWENDPQNASKVVDENGEPLVVYHGTDAEFTQFQVGKEGGIFFTEYKRIAAGFSAHIKYGKFRKETNTYIRLYDCFLNIKKIKNIDYGNKPNVSGIKSEITKGKKQGYDGILLKNAMDFGGRANQYICFEPSQIKLADGTNVTFDGSNPDVRYSDGGEVPLLMQKGVVQLKMYDTTPEHAKQYGIEAKKPLYVQNLLIDEKERLKGLGKKVLNYIDTYASENGNDVIFGHISQKAVLTKSNNQTSLTDTDLIKKSLNNNIEQSKQKIQKFMQNTEQTQQYKVGGKITPSQIKLVHDAIDKLENTPNLSLKEKANVHKYKLFFDKIITETDEAKIKKLTSAINTFIKRDDLFIGKKNAEADLVRMYLDALVTSKRKEHTKQYDVTPLYDWLNTFTSERKKILNASNDFVNNPKTDSQKEMSKIVNAFSQIIQTVAMPDKIGLYDESEHHTMRAEVKAEIQKAKQVIQSTKYAHYYDTFMPRFKKILESVIGVKKLEDGGAVVNDLDDVNVKKEQGVYVGNQNDKSGGIIVGKRHSECDDDGCGEKFKVGGTGQVIEVEGGEIALGAESMNATDKYTFEGRKLTPKEIASYLNVKGGGVKFDNTDKEFKNGGNVKINVKMAHGGEVAKGVLTHFKGGEYVITVKGSQSKEKYNFEGEELTPREILSKLNSTYGGKAF